MDLRLLALPPEIVCRVCPRDYKDAMRLWCTAKSIQKSLLGTGVQVELDNKFDRRSFVQHEQLTIARMQTWASFTTIAISESYEVEMEEAAAAGTPGIWWLEGVLRNCKGLVNIDLSHNYIEEKGMEKLAISLGDWESLKDLDLSTNMLKDKGATWVAHVLPKCEALKTLDLRNNCISDKGAAMLAGVIGKCKRLTHIDLSDNCIEDEGARMLAGALQHRHKAVAIDLRYNEIQHGTKHELEKLGQVYV